MQSSSTRDLMVGVFVLIGLMAIGWLSLRIGGLSFSREGGLVLFATFDDVGGLSRRSPVRIAGVRVGQVDSIELDEDLRARVVIDVQPDLELSIDTAAAIRTSGLLGDQFMSLEPGADDLLLESGDDFSFTESAWSVDALVGELVHGDADLESE
ncbi:MAG: outer membrane lipid asymmetry maintenance protein MlaD [Deltaproteobacteria bacterium]|nr:outer membrane lipid asymmetry maintenance protein MlaD [Deltaproteobacteria bacterium]MBW2697514.1 outer membrane lipid asymmetry maintenance protein MlaD [Deltaproteobacteria bacterium]